jgi:hypothetical protein
MERAWQRLLRGESVEQLALTQTNTALYIGAVNMRHEFSCHPLSWCGRVFTARNEFQRVLGQYDQEAKRRDGIIHGDFHSGNILLETGAEKRVWLIDFPHVHIGPVIRDIACLEADIKFNLLPSVLLRQNFHTLPVLETEVLGNGSRPDLDLSKKTRPALPDETEEWSREVDKMWQCLAFFRSFVRNVCLVSPEAHPYYLALLHATLPVLYYEDRTAWQKLYAFVSAARLCELLQS